MSQVSRLLGVLLGVAALSCQMSAQNPQTEPWQYKAEVFGNIAHGYVFSSGRDWGKGLDYGGGVGFRPFSGALGGLGFEVQVAKQGSTMTNLGPNASSHLDSHLVAADVLYHFRKRTMVQPYVLGGIGWMSADYSYKRGAVTDPLTGQIVPPNELNVSGSKTGVTLGAGVKIAVNRHLSIRPEIFFLNTNESVPYWNWLRFQIGLGFHL